MYEPYETYEPDPPPIETPDTDTVPPRRPSAPARRPAPAVEPSWPRPNGAPPARPGLLAAPIAPIAPIAPTAPIAPPEPRRPAPAPERDFGDDPLGTGYIGPTFEASTPLADQSWETVLRGRRRDGAADGEPGGDPRDFPRFRRPPEP